ncbi:hypothetical protein RJ640_018108 [Escallonia rubra]|uniref:Cystatin domain-containing protein n=1 Tax=Escallonia rubra TaxID=112253 RepID=A0AA88QDW1_9ASTE|nr:hypothetical protein RJ640_018108 [Escallonia rubra]
MEEITEGMQSIAIAGDSHKKNRIQVSNTKKPLFFYVNLAKRYMAMHNEVELSALGMGMFVSFPLLQYLSEAVNREIQELGRYSVKEYNRKRNGGYALKFTEVVEAETQVVSCIKYYLMISAATPTAIATVVTIAEILKNNGFAVEKKIMTSTVDMKDDTRGRPIQKAKIEILLGKTENFDELIAAAAEERELAPPDEES